MDQAAERAQVNAPMDPAELLSDLSELADEIEGVTLPPGMVGTCSVTLHTTEQVQNWLQAFEARVRDSGAWNPWGDQ